MPDTPASPVANPPRTRMRFRPGLSLVELLVVMAVIAVLLAIIFTAVHAAIKMVRTFKGG